MSQVRALTLEEWFTDYQLQFIWSSYCHLPGSLDIDVSGLVSATEAAGIRLSPTAITVKAAGLLVEEMPLLNRVLLRTPWGPRVLELNEIRVNMPVQIENRGQPMLSAMVLANPQRESAGVLQAKIRDFASGNLDDKPIGRFLTNRGNWFWNRALLRLLHVAAYRLPWMYAKRGGGISVSSIIRTNTNHPRHLVALGHTALTLLISGIDRDANGRSWLRIGFDGNHSILSGAEIGEATARLAAILGNSPPERFYPELAGARP